MKQLSPSELNNLSREDMAAIILRMQKQLDSMSQRLEFFQARLFGRATEKLSQLPGQLSFNEAEAVQEPIQIEPTAEQAAPRRKKQKGKRKEDLSELPVRIEKHELTQEELISIYGKNGWKRLPDEVYSRVEYKPSVKEVVEHHVAVYSGKKSEEITRADRPVDLLRNSIATPSLVAAIMNGKYTNAMPLYRIEQEMDRTGLCLSRATMGNWVIRCTERYLSLVYDRMQELLCKEAVLQVDETRCQVTKDGREGICKSQMYVYRTSELRKEHPIILYKYEKTRNGRNVLEFLKGFSGILESDAFKAYSSLDKGDNPIRAAFCWAHARRDFADALKVLKGDAKKLAHETVAHKALVQIGHIYKAEEALKDLSAEERQIRRHDEVLPLVEAYFAWVREQDIVTISNEKTRDGLRYSLNQEKYLRVFLENGDVPIDNSATERAIRPFTVGRNNWHIIDTVHGAQASAMIYSLVETAKANDLRIYEYLKHLLTEIPKHLDGTDMSFVDDLLPWAEALPKECRRK